MIDLGDVVALSWTVRDSAGQPVDAGVVTVSVTLPDGSTASPLVTHSGTGQYAASLATAQAGRHVIRWVATGANAGAYTDVLWVPPADPGMIIPLSYARTAIRALPTQTGDDEDLRDLLVAATGPMEDICGAIVPRPFDEWYDGGGMLIALDHSPVISVATVTESIGSTRTLTAQPLDGVSMDAYGYTIDKDLGVLTRRAAGVATPFAPGRSNVHVTYTAGRQQVPWSILRATRRLVLWLWQTEVNGVRATGPAALATTTTPAGYAVPNAVIEMCGTEARIRAQVG